MTPGMTNKFEDLMIKLRAESAVERAKAKASGEELMNRAWRVSTG